MSSLQKVGAVLKKAGFERSIYLPSGRIKGWGNSTEGYRARRPWNSRAVAYVEYVRGSWVKFDAEREAAILVKYREALEAAALHVVADGDGLLIFAQADRNPEGEDPLGAPSRSDESAVATIGSDAPTPRSSDD